ncbi:MAG: tRNA pseudouridine(55) synthase TruB [Clostridia bacterium]|nr:tRNA pseudouridine(55) synthase TruB [Clostridia bacterium]
MSDNLSGVLILDKPDGITSHDAVNKMRHIFSTKKVGHTGTLDPMATGVLPILIGGAVKASEYLMSEDKEYVAKMVLGIETDTEDTSGMTIKTSDYIPSDSEVIKAVNSFLGDYDQIPPMYSALKVGGEKLYDKARRGETVEREARRVRVDEIEAKKLSEREWEIRAKVSKGTYIRTLLADIGKKLGCGGAMGALRRTLTGDFTIENAYTLEEVEKANDLRRLLVPTEELFKKYEKVILSEFYLRLAKNGAEIYLSRAKLQGLCEGQRVRMYDSDGAFFALGEVRAFPSGLAVKPIKFFN